MGRQRKAPSMATIDAQIRHEEVDGCLNGRHRLSPGEDDGGEFRYCKAGCGHSQRDTWDAAAGTWNRLTRTPGPETVFVVESVDHRQVLRCRTCRATVPMPPTIDALHTLRAEHSPGGMVTA